MKRKELIMITDELDLKKTKTTSNDEGLGRINSFSNVYSIFMQMDANLVFKKQSRHNPLTKVNLQCKVNLKL